MDPDRVVVDDIESNAFALAERAVPLKSKAETVSRGEGGRKKHKEFLELKEGHMTVSEYKREFVKLSKYARECVPSEAKMCRGFQDGVNEDIKTLVGILELKEFVVLFERACKAENLVKERKKGEYDVRYKKENSSFRSQVTSVASMDNAKPSKAECPQCGRCHSRNCRVCEGSCFKCGSLDHFIKDYPEMMEKERFQSPRLSGAASRGRPSRNAGHGFDSKNVIRDTAVRSEAKALARAYAIRACEDATSPHVITDTDSVLGLGPSDFVNGLGPTVIDFEKGLRPIDSDEG
ncbi:uncharacterized protein [Gossypium hirsutum]|uniref:Gag-Pol polyprotein n=1 Tax=Gossypium hirsutum TaxID=3635 RepID=A0ABM2YMW1_GOSHI|nr:uncharacterized protein LOC121205012 [Gossypium hirsutum]